MKINSTIIDSFLDWTKLKVKIESANKNAYPRRREIWWVNLGQNIGVETNGKNNQFERPVLVIKVFNMESLLIAPITSKVKNNKYVIEYINQDGLINGISISQLRTISMKRLDRKVSEISQIDFDKVINTIINNILIKETPFGVSSKSYIEGHNLTETSHGISSESPTGEHNALSLPLTD
ncbi:MAG: type II toxin-antitoxin system PemK/MazF family toxin [Patescibacteria group bacterium]